MINKNMLWNDLQDIKQLEGLIRAHIILAQMSEKSSYDYKDYIFKSYYSMTRLIYVSVNNALASLKEIQKIAATTANQPTEPAGASSGDKKKSEQTKSKTAAAVESKVLSQLGKKLKTDSGASGFLPQTIEQWSQFEITDEITSAWSHEIMKKTGINQNTIAEPYLLFYYLDQLAQMLSDLGFSSLLFPLYNLQMILVNNLIKFDTTNKNLINQQQLISLVFYVKLKCINLCVELNLINSVSIHQISLINMISNLNKQTNLATPSDTPLNGQVIIDQNPSILLKLIQIDSNEVCVLREQIYAHKQRLAQLENEEAAMNASSSMSASSRNKSTTTIHSKTSKKKNMSNKSLYNVKINESHKKKVNSEDGINLGNKTDNAVDDINLPGEYRRVNDTLHESLYKDIWISLAELLIHNGFFQSARDYIFESLNASVVS
jgi:hypothetical protein